jgi:hypothetical protein
MNVVLLIFSNQGGSTMSHTVHNELMALAAEFTAQRRSENKRWFPESLWKKAVALAQQTSVGEVSLAINVSSNYLKRKMQLLTHDSEMSFVELIAPQHVSPHILRINFESVSGHKMILDGIDSTAVVPPLAEFLREGGRSCCK